MQRNLRGTSQLSTKLFVLWVTAFKGLLSKSKNEGFPENSWVIPRRFTTETQRHGGDMKRTLCEFESDQTLRALLGAPYDLIQIHTTVAWGGK